MLKHLIFSVLVFASLTALAWGQKGHDVVAHIGERHLSEAAADSVAKILDGRSMVYWANWLDNASHTPDYAYTKTWHYKNINADQVYDQVPPHADGDVVYAVYEQAAILEAPNSTPAQKQLALKILIHVMGDMHQPMHLGRLTDRGGNTHKLEFFGRDNNLHSIWDSGLVDRAHAWSYSEWAEQLDILSPEQQEAIIKGSPDDWGAETHDITTRIYQYFPEGSKVSFNQLAYWTPTIEDQLLRGGLRLASVLNSIYGSDAAEEEELETEAVMAK